MSWKEYNALRNKLEFYWLTHANITIYGLKVTAIMQLTTNNKLSK